MELVKDANILRKLDYLRQYHKRIIQKVGITKFFFTFMGVFGKL